MFFVVFVGRFRLVGLGLGQGGGTKLWFMLVYGARGELAFRRGIRDQGSVSSSFLIQVLE